MWHASHMLHRACTLPQSIRTLVRLTIRTLVRLTNMEQHINHSSLKARTHEMTLWKVWEFRYMLYLNLNGREQRFSNRCQEQTWNNGDLGWTVTNSGSAMGIRKRRETITMSDERSQTVVQQWVSGRDMKQWRYWMNGQKHSQPWL